MVRLNDVRIKAASWTIFPHGGTGALGHELFSRPEPRLERGKSSRVYGEHENLMRCMFESRVGVGPPMAMPRPCRIRHGERVY